MVKISKSVEAAETDRNRMSITVCFGCAYRWVHKIVVSGLYAAHLRVHNITAGNIHEMHKHIFVFGVDSLHLTAQYRLQLVDSPCQRPADHSATSTKTLMVAVRV